MKSFRVRIVHILVAIVLIAATLGALRDSRPIAASLYASGALALLVVALIVAQARQGRERAVWLGFAMTGWAYMLASLVPAIEPMPVTAAYSWLYDWVGPEPVVNEIRRPILPGELPGANFFPVRIYPDRPTFPGGNVTQRLLATRSQGSFVRIGHCVTALLVGSLGSLLASWLHDRDEAPTEGVRANPNLFGDTA